MVKETRHSSLYLRYFFRLLLRADGKRTEDTFIQVQSIKELIMKATLFAVVLSLSVLPFNIHAESETLPVAEVSGSLTQESKAIHLNQADVATLTQSFKGIGKKRAEAIIAYREANGPFKSLEDLGQVKGIGHQFVAKNLAELQAIYVID